MDKTSTTISPERVVSDSAAETVVALTLPEWSFVDGVLDAAQLQTGVRMLDLGCGTGRLLSQAAQREPSAVLVGVDVDADRVELARRRARSAPTRIEIHKCDAQELPFSDDYFDVVSMTLVLGSLPWRTRGRILEQTRRVLSPGGRIVIADFASRGCLLARWLHDATDLIPGSAYWSSGKPMDISRDIVNSGFEPPQLIRTYCTISGAIDLIVAHKPLVT